jgi:mono/diheme cytochrome c family protein
MRATFFASVVALVGVAWTWVGGQQPVDAARLNPRPTQAVAGRGLSPAEITQTYCVSCHNDRLKTGGLSLEQLSLERAGQDAETLEKVIRKVRAGLMPPAGARRPERAVLDDFAADIETAVDRAAAANPNPGRAPLHRMNRVEYANAVRDLLALDIDPTTLLPADDSSRGFDNIADVLGVSPSLLERYVAAAAKVSRLAVGERDASPNQVTYTVRGDLSQNRTLDGQPLGTRGGTIVKHTFPADGDYQIKLSLLKLSFGQVFGEGAEGEELEVTLNGTRVKLFKLDEVPMFFQRQTPG